MKFRSFTIAVVFLIALTATCAGAKLKPANIFGDHMVVQADLPLRVWGNADANDDVAVSFGGNEQKTRAVSSGRWRAILPALPAGGPFVMDLRAGEETVQIQD